MNPEQRKQQLRQIDYGDLPAGHRLIKEYKELFGEFPWETDDREYRESDYYKNVENPRLERCSELSQLAREHSDKVEIRDPTDAEYDIAFLARRLMREHKFEHSLTALDVYRCMQYCQASRAILEGQCPDES